MFNVYRNIYDSFLFAFAILNSKTIFAYIISPSLSRLTSASDHESLVTRLVTRRPPWQCQLGTMVMTNGDSNTAYKLGSSSTNWCLLNSYWLPYSHSGFVIGCCYLSRAGLDSWWSQGELGHDMGRRMGHWAPNIIHWWHDGAKRSIADRGDTVGSDSNCSNDGLVGKRDNPANAKYFTISTCDLSPL